MGGEGGLKRVLQNCVAGGDEFYEGPLVIDHTYTHM